METATMQPLNRNDLLSLEQYADQRPAFRTRASTCDAASQIS